MLEPSALASGVYQLRRVAFPDRLREEIFTARFSFVERYLDFSLRAPDPYAGTTTYSYEHETED